jgi:hypothetical protein
MTELSIAPPDPSKPPQVVNVFHMSRIANTALMPLFPYGSDGDIVAGLSLFSGGSNRDLSVFKHKNSVDEVAIVFGSAQSRLSAGDILVGAREHTVGSILENYEDPYAFALMVIVQRHADLGVPQSETMTFFCEKCQAPIVEHHFEGKNENHAAVPGCHPPFATVIESARALDTYNVDAGARVCPACGHVNAPFPIATWGWEEYRRNFHVGERARRQFIACGEGVQ